MKKIEDYKGTTTAIKVNSVEQFDKIKKLLEYKQSGSACFGNTQPKDDCCVSCNSDDYCDSQYDLEDNFIREWSSVKEAMATLKIFKISKAARGERKKAGGFKWKYK